MHFSSTHIIQIMFSNYFSGHCQLQVSQACGCTKETCRHSCVQLYSNALGTRQPGTKLQNNAQWGTVIFLLNCDAGLINLFWSLIFFMLSYDFWMTYYDRHWAVDQHTSKAVHNSPTCRWDWDSTLVQDKQGRIPPACLKSNKCYKQSLVGKISVRIKVSIDFLHHTSSH